MEPNTLTSLNIIRSLDDLLVLLFWKIIGDNNFMLLCPDYKPESEYTDSQKSEVLEVWYRLYDEYYKQCEDSRSKHDLRKGAIELSLSQRITSLCKSLEGIMWLQNHHELLPEENYMKMYMDAIGVLIHNEPKLKGKLNIFDVPTDTILKVNRYIASLSNQLKKLTQGKEKRVEKSVQNIYNKVAFVGAELGMQLNVKEMSCNEWLAYQSMASQKQHAKREQHTKNKKR